MAAIQCLRPCPNKLPKKKRLLTSPLFLPLRREESRICSGEMNKNKQKLTLALASDAKCRKQTKE